MFEQIFGVSFILFSLIVWIVMRSAERIRYIKMTAFK